MFQILERMIQVRHNTLSFKCCQVFQILDQVIQIFESNLVGIIKFTRIYFCSNFKRLSQIFRMVLVRLESDRKFSLQKIGNIPMDYSKIADIPNGNIAHSHWEFPKIGDIPNEIGTFPLGHSQKTADIPN